MTTTDRPKFSAKIKASEARREVQMRERVYTRNGGMRADDRMKLEIMKEIAADYARLDAEQQAQVAPRLL